MEGESGGPKNHHESRPSSEALTVHEILKTPGITIGVFATGRGLQVPIYFRTEKSGTDDQNLVLPSHLSPHSSNINALDEVTEIRGSRKPVDLEKSFQKHGFFWRSVRVGKDIYVALYVPTRDYTGNRQGYKGMLVAWGEDDAVLNEKMAQTLFKNKEVLRTVLSLWETVYSNRNVTASRVNQREAETDFFRPPSPSELDEIIKNGGRA
jgi:hypothetical protein